MSKREKDQEQKAAQAASEHAESAEVPEDIVPEEPAAGTQDPLPEELEHLKASLSAKEEQYLRLAAEYDNFRKRSAREQDAAFGNGVAHAVSQILSILDTLEMAEAAPTADENFKKGVTLTLEKAKAAFEALKVEEIPALGQPFDPAVHNAVMQKAAENGEESGTVLQVFQKGYKLGDKVIRHATVIVAE